MGGSRASHDQSTLDVGLLPTVEEILRAWARDASAFVSADEKVKSYLSELERLAVESGNTADLELLQTFQRTWNTLASELLGAPAESASQRGFSAPPQRPR